MGLCVRWCEPVRALVCSQKLQILCKPRDCELLAAHLLEKADLDKNQDLSITEFYSLLNYMYEAIGTSEVLALLTLHCRLLPLHHELTGTDARR